MNETRATAGPLALAVALCAIGCDDGSAGRLYVASETAQSAEVICPDGETVDGIDVSYWQGDIDWSAVAADGIEFAFIRVSDGLGYYDTEFQDNWEGAQANGIIRGAYQFFRSDEDAVAQADLLLEEIGTFEEGDLPPVIDVETTDGQTSSTIVSKVQQWIDHVEAATGRAPIIYTAKWFWQSNVGSSAFADYPLWAANWEVACPDIPDQWSSWTFWQHTDSGSVSGISGNVDMNVFNGDLDALMDFAEYTPEPCEPIPPEGRIVDETDPCFDPNGNPEWWHHSDTGWDGALIYTYTTDWAEPENYCVWNLNFEDAGEYLLEVITTAPLAMATLAEYQVRYDGADDEQIVDQSAVDGWQEIGEYPFAAGGDQWVRLDDNTGEPLADDISIVCDALRVTRLDLPDAGVDGGSDSDSDSDSDVDAGPEPPSSEDSCGCAAAGRRPIPLLALLVSLLS
jgi:lysozyme